MYYLGLPRKAAASSCMLRDQRTPPRSTTLQILHHAPPSRSSCLEEMASDPLPIATISHANSCLHGAIQPLAPGMQTVRWEFRLQAELHWMCCRKRCGEKCYLNSLCQQSRELVGACKLNCIECVAENVVAKSAIWILCVSKVENWWGLVVCKRPVSCSREKLTNKAYKHWEGLAVRCVTCLTSVWWPTVCRGLDE